MIDITLKANLKAIEDFAKFSKDFRKEVIENGLDEPIAESVQDLKTSLKEIVSTVGVSTTQTTPTTPSTEPAKPTFVNTRFDGKDGDTKIRKSSKDLIEYLTGIKLDNVPAPGQHYTKSTDSNVFFMKKGLFKYRAPVSPYSDFDTERMMASTRFKNSIFVDEDGNMYLPKRHLVMAKPECSNEPGDTDKSKRVFESRKNSQKPHRQEAIEKTGIGPFVTWTTFQADSQNIVKGSINLRDVIDKIEEGDLDAAASILKSSQKDKLVDDMLQKIDSISSKDKTVPEAVRSFVNIQELINNLKVLKSIKKTTVTYTLVTTVTVDDSPENKNFIQELDKTISMWILTSENEWFEGMVEKAQEFIDEFENKG